MGDKVHGLTERTWAPTDLSALEIQEGDSSAVQERPRGAGLGSAQVCNLQIHAQPPKREVHASSRPLQQKTGRSLRSGIVPLSAMVPPKRETLGEKRPLQQKSSGNVPLSGVSSLPLAPRLEPVATQPQHEKTAPARLQAEVPVAAPAAQFEKLTAA